MTDDQRPIDDDDFLIAVLASTLDVVEPLRDDFADAVRSAAFSSRNLDSKLLAVIADSLAGAGMRSEHDERLLTFGDDDDEIEISLAVGVTGSITGVVTPVPAGVVALETPEGSIAIEIDDLGRFTTSTAARVFRIVLTEPGRRTDATEWISR
jgi:hypothetical protein